MMFWKRKKRPTEDEVAALMATSIEAQQELDSLLNHSDYPQSPMDKAKHEIAVHKARRKADHARWAAHSAGIKAGIIEDVCFW